MEPKETNRLSRVSVIPFAVLVLLAGSSLVSLRVTISMTALPFQMERETKVHFSRGADTSILASPDIALQNIQKPQLVIHVGPPKTATTTIQQTLSMPEWKAVLATDSYLYTGVFLTRGTEDKRSAMDVSKRVKDFDCSRSMSNARATLQQQDANRTLYEIVSEVPCATAMLEALEKYRVLNQSLIISDESLGFKSFKYVGIDKTVPLDWISLASLLQPHWDVSVVVVYRRYFDWLPSAKQQMERWTPRKAKMNKWNAQGGKVPGPLFPDYWKLEPGHSLLRYFFADYLVESTRQYLPVTLVNLHHPGGDSARSIFLCYGLPGAKNSCRTSRDRDREEGEERMSNPSLTTSYDTLVMAADAAGIISNTSKLKRRDITQQAMSHHRDALNETSADFPVLCPQQTEYKAFLNKSLSLEQKVLPNFSNSRHGEAEHKEEFWKAVEERKFCHIDTAKVLENPRWTAFFRSLTN